MTIKVGKADAKRIKQFLDDCSIRYKTTELKKGVELNIKCRKADEPFINNWLNIGVKEMRDYIRTARDLDYPRSCIYDMYHCTSEPQVIRVLTTYRLAG